MTEFVDPRLNPAPPSRVTRDLAASGEDVRELVRLCWVGRVYEVERWIQEGHPIQAVTYKRFKKPPVITPLRTSVRRCHRDIVLLLLCNGYRLDLEPEHWNSLLDEALDNSSFEIVDLLLKWGADPRKVRPESVFETYKTELIDRFWRAGLDYTAGTELASYLASTVNKPLYGWLRRNRTDQRLQDVLDIALLEAVEKDHELPANLLLWAGADPHRKVPPIWALGDASAWDDECVSSSAEAAVSWGRHRMLDLLRVKEMPDLDDQLARADDLTTLKWLVALRAPSDWSEVILNFARKLCWRHSSGRSWDARYALRFAAEKGGRLTTISSDEIRRLRSELLDARDADDFLWLVKWLKKEKNCDRAIYFELTRTRAVQQKLAAVTAGTPYLSPSQKMSRANERRRRARAREQAAAPSTTE
jgi:hypothetical protein